MRLVSILVPCLVSIGLASVAGCGERKTDPEEPPPIQGVEHDFITVFLVDVFHGNEPLADSVIHLLVVGFYLINLGYVSLALKLGYEIASAKESIEALSVKVGTVLLVLGGMHFFNLFIFSRMRRRTTMRNGAPPVYPDAFTPVQEV